MVFYLQMVFKRKSAICIKEGYAKRHAKEWRYQMVIITDSC